MCECFAPPLDGHPRGDTGAITPEVPPFKQLTAVLKKPAPSRRRVSFADEAGDKPLERITLVPPRMSAEDMAREAAREARADALANLMPTALFSKVVDNVLDGVFGSSTPTFVPAFGVPTFSGSTPTGNLSAR